MSRVRRAASEALVQVFKGRSLSEVLPPAMEGVPVRDRAFLQALCFAVLRQYHRLHFILHRLLDKPLRDGEIRALAMVGLAQLACMEVKPHAAVSETVSAAARKRWARPLLNALLRGYLRRRGELEAAAEDDFEAAVSHPAWLRQRIDAAWPRQAGAILAANNRHPPMVLRVNLDRCEREDYCRLLQVVGFPARPLRGVNSALILAKPVAVTELPGFAEGLVSVQDAAAQLAAPLLDLQGGQRVLDVCAAPGGKTMHLLEDCPSLAEVVAVDVSEVRLARLEDNLTRLGETSCQVLPVCGDARDPDSWWDGRPFDRILVDAPCSATGVIRRHPDIKLLRRDGDIDALARVQREILEAVWPLLAGDGILVYATCSVLPQENERQIRAFVAAHADAEPFPIAAVWGEGCGIGRQILPGEMDGFFYARIRKCASRR